MDPTKLAVVPPTTVTAVIDPAVARVVQATEDSAAVLWLADQTRTAAATTALLANQTNASIEEIWSGEILKTHFPDPLLDPRVPDIIAWGKPGTIYTTSNNKMAEHGGKSDQDTQVPIVISNPNLAPQKFQTPVLTTQIAPTILQLLGLNPWSLQAVQIEKTPVLPGLEAAQTALGAVTSAFGSNSVAMTANGQSQFQVTLSRTQEFRVEASTDLTNWMPISTNSIVVGASATLHDADAGSYSNRFYRAVSSP